jgi:serine/threonine protein phosphatase PrpC
MAVSTEAPASGGAGATDSPVGARLARGPLVVGEGGPAVAPRLTAAELYRPDSVADGGLAYGLTVRAASVRGLAKRYDGGPRQDDLCLRRHDATRTLIVAVADGVSAAPRSDLGAALAVRQAAAAVAGQLDAGGDEELDWVQVFEHTAWALVEQARRDGDGAGGPTQAGRALATTLVVAAIHADSGRIQVAAVGDSPALLLTDERLEALFAPVDRDGLVGAPVDALPRSAGLVHAVACPLPAGAVLLLCTDGLALPLGDGRGELGKVLIRELGEPPDIVDFARLLDFSASTYDDDRTLVAVWS